MHAVKLEQGEMTGWGIVSVWMCVSMYVKLEQGIVSVWMCVCTILHGVVRM